MTLDGYNHVTPSDCVFRRRTIHATGDMQRFLFSAEPPPVEALGYHVVTGWMK
jgi:hypothetical protein